MVSNLAPPTLTKFFFQARHNNMEPANAVTSIDNIFRQGGVNYGTKLFLRICKISSIAFKNRCVTSWDNISERYYLGIFTNEPISLSKGRQSTCDSLVVVTCICFSLFNLRTLILISSNDFFSGWTFLTFIS